MLAKANMDSDDDEPEDCLERGAVGEGHCQPSNVIGIDLGTTYSCVGLWVNGRVEILQNEAGSRTTPSWVSFSEEERLVGEGAKAQAAGNTGNTLYDVKRLIGQNYSAPGVQADMKHLMYDVTKGDNDKPIIKLNVGGEEKLLTPEQVSSMILVKMKTIAETFLGHGVSKAVITVPAYFNDAQVRIVELGLACACGMIHSTISLSDLNDEKCILSDHVVSTLTPSLAENNR